MTAGRGSGGNSQVGPYALILDDGGDTARFYTVNQTTGALTQVGGNHALGTGTWWGAGLTVVGSTVYALLTDDTSNTARFYTVNQTTGALTQVGSNHALGSGSWSGAGLAVVGSTVYALLAEVAARPASTQST